VFKDLRGVASVVSGYMGGHLIKPSYRQVCEGDSGHAEVVQINFDPAQLPYADVLGVFFSIHDPTTLNRQGNDHGTQYRSAIFYHSPEQQGTAQRVMAEVAPLFEAPIVTELNPVEQFYPAEDYHQDYFSKNPAQPYCMFVVAPKVVKFRKQYVDRLKR